MGSGRGGTTATTTGNKKSSNGGVGGAAATGGSGLQSIPSGSRKIVQSLREIVNCPEPEIYAMLKECNMDPNDAVNRLLSQDTFHEVKSKREKKKENKDSSEFRGRGSSATLNSGRSRADRYAGRGSSAQYNSSDSAALHGRPAYKKENGSTPYTSPLSSSSGMSANNLNRRPSSYSDAAVSEVKMPVGLVDGSTSISQPPSGYQSAWVGAPGQKSMADIVKMGKPQSKASSVPNTSLNVSNHHVETAMLSQCSMQFSEDHSSKFAEENLELVVSSGQHVSIEDEWPSIEQPLGSSVPSMSKIHGDSELHQDPPNLSFDTINRQSHIDEVGQLEDGTIESHGGSSHVASASVTNRNVQEDNSGGSYLFDNDLYRNRTTYQSNNHTLEHEVDVSIPVSSVTANLRLSIQEEDPGLPAEGNGPSVVIPDHLQVQSADCSHLSFGSFGSGISASFSGPLASMPVKTTLEHETQEVDASLVGHSDARNSEYYVDESLRNATEGNIFQRAGANTGNYDSSSVQQPEPLKVEDPEMEHESQYAFPSSAPGYSFENSQQLNIGYTQAQTSSHMQNLTPFSNVMPAYTNSLSTSLLSANAPPGRDSDLPYSPFPVTQSTAAKYGGNSVSSITGPTISMTEALKTASFSSAQPTSQSISGASVAKVPALPQHLTHPYTQPTLPLGPFANVISYPYMPQSYAYIPSAFQQTFAGNSTYHQSLAAAVLPQYKNSVSISSLPQSAAVASGYGGFGNSTTIPGNFPMNPPAAPSSTNLSYDDVLNAQYKDTSHLLSLQQNDSSGMWIHGHGSRTMSALPSSTYYSLQGQNQQSAGGFRQSHQPSQNYGALGYPNYYQSQTGMSLDQHQNPRDGSLGGSQVQPKQSQQLWQNNY